MVEKLRGERKLTGRLPPLRGSCTLIEELGSRCSAMQTDFTATDFTEDQRQFHDVVAKFLDDKSPVAAVRSLLDSKSGYDEAVWRQMCRDVGLAGIHIPEQYGGAGFGPVELGIVCQEMGRTLYSGPYFSSAVMAGYVLLYCGGDDIKSSLLPEIAAGERIATVVADNLNDLTLAGQHMTVNGGVLEGQCAIATDAHIADVLLVIADDDLYLVESDAEGVAIEQRQSLDPTRRISKVTFTGAKAEKAGSARADRLNAAWDDMCIALSLEMMGGAQRLFDTTIEYMGMRYQFGRPIGSFQGLKHRCADLLLELEWSRAVVQHAAFSRAVGEDEPHIASMAKAMASDVYMKAAKEAIQLRGGIGFTWEEDTHLWYKRAKSSEVFLGSPHLHRERVISLMENAA